MKTLALVAGIASLTVLAQGQSVSLGLSPHILPYAEYEIPTYKTKINHLKDWVVGTDASVAPTPHSIGFDLVFVEHRFASLKLGPFDLADAYWHVAPLGFGLFDQQRGIRRKFELGITIR